MSAICLGCWAMGARGWGEVDDGNSIAAIQAAIDLGVTFIDTAEVYGFGHSEEVVGKALKGRRDKVILATKKWAENNTRQSILTAIDESLRRLDTDHVDLYQVHWPNEETPLEETMTAMSEVLRAGKARWIGVSNFTVDQLEYARGFCPVTSVQPPYSMLRRESEQQLLPYCQRERLGVMVYSPLQKGLLTGKYTGSETFPEDDFRGMDKNFQGDRFLANARMIDQLKPIAARHGRSLAQLAIAWTLANPAVTSAIVGAKTPQQVEENLGGQGWRLSPEELQEIDQILRAA